MAFRKVGVVGGSEELVEAPLEEVEEEEEEVEEEEVKEERWSWSQQHP